MAPAETSTGFLRIARRDLATAIAMADPSLEDVLGALERLGELQRKGILTEEEFAAKKADLLSRL